MPSPRGSADTAHVEVLEFTNDRGEAVRRAESLIDEADADTAIYVSDGSKLSSQNCGFASVSVDRVDGRHLLTVARSSSTYERSVYDLELLGIGMSLTWAASRPDLPRLRKLILLLDDQAAIGAAFDPSPRPGQQLSLYNRRVLEVLRSHNDQLAITLAWTPGHEGSVTNECADQEAKLAAREATEGELANDPERKGVRLATASTRVADAAAWPRSLAAVRATHEASLLPRWKAMCAAESTGKRLREINGEPGPTNRARHTNLSRAASSILTQLRTGKVGLNQQLYRQGHADSPYCPLCPDRIDDSRRHFICECRGLARLRVQLWQSIPRRHWHDGPFLLSDPNAQLNTQCCSSSSSPIVFRASSSRRA